MATIGSGRRGFVAAQRDRWLRVRISSSSAAFEPAQWFVARLGGHFVLRESEVLFRYRNGCGLTGFHDGTENLTGGDAPRTALAFDRDDAGGSFVMVQRFAHRHASFGHLCVQQQSLITGRERESDEEIEDAPQTARVKRAAPECFDPPRYVWRRSMPWGTPAAPRPAIYRLRDRSR
jgi:putative iron-dependent peroxidase